MLQNRVRHHRRYQEIMNTFIKHGFSHMLFRLGLTDRVSRMKGKVGETEAQLADIGKNLRQALQSLGPSFIKLGQIASSRRDIVPEEIAIELERLQDDVQSFDYEVVAQIIERELGDRPENLFQSFNEEPLATASIGQVHVATLLSGEEVAIKIQRPDIEDIMVTDLEILHSLARVLDKRVAWARTYRIKDIIEEFSFSLKNELDYLLEGRNSERIAEQFIDDDRIKIPKVYWDYTTKKVLTMELIRGIKVNHYEELQEKGYDTKLIASRITDAMLQQILDASFFHGDPHPGNIYILPNNRVAFLDFGMIGRLSNDLKYYFSSLIISLQSGDTDGMINTFKEWGLLDHVEQMNALRRDIDSLQLQYYEVPLHHISLGNVMFEVFEIAYKHRIEIPSDIAILGKTIITLESTLENLDPELSIMEAIEPYGKKLLLKRYHPLNMARKSWRSIFENIRILSELPRDIKDISATMKRGKLQFDINIFEIQYILSKLDRIANRIAFSVIMLAFTILMSGLIIGASIAGKTVLLWKVPVIEIGFIIAAIMFLFMVYAIIRSGRM